MTNETEATEVKPEPTLSLTLAVSEANLILAALQELPHKVSDTLIRKIMGQAGAQLAQKVEEPEANKDTGNEQH